MMGRLQKSYKYLTFFALFSGLSALSQFSFAESPKLVQVNMAKKSLMLELADDDELRARGLMHRKSLCPDCGMVFSYPNPRFVNFWMKNTFIALDLAFVTREGVISQIVSLEPHDLTGAGSNSKVSYVIEMNKGWFAQHKIAVGDFVSVAPHD